MKRNIKLPNGAIQAIDCKLGSGIFDFNGNEIFEGDTVEVSAGNQRTVVFKRGAFRIGDECITRWGSVLEIVDEINAVENYNK